MRRASRLADHGSRVHHVRTTASVRDRTRMEPEPRFWQPSAQPLAVQIRTTPADGFRTSVRLSMAGRPCTPRRRLFSSYDAATSTVQCRRPLQRPPLRERNLVVVRQSSRRLVLGRWIHTDLGALEDARVLYMVKLLTVVGSIAARSGRPATSKGQPVLTLTRTPRDLRAQGLRDRAEATSDDDSVS